MSAWIQTYDSLTAHPKTKRLARNLAVSLNETIGILTRLWFFTMEYAPDGDLSGFTEDDISEAVGWDSEPSSLIAALQDTGPKKSAHGFLDGMHVHDWDDYGGKLYRKKESDAQRKRESREKDADTPSDGRPTDVLRTAQVEEKRGDKKRGEERRHPLAQLAIDEIPTTESTSEDYQRTIDRHAPRLRDQTIKQTIYELAAWEPKTPRKKLHLTLNAWLAKRPDDREPEEEESPGYERFAVTDIPDYWVQS